MDLSIIIPTFNEQGNIREIAGRIHSALQGSALSYEIWFIDDSTDETPLLLDALTKEFPHIHYYHRENQRGLGTAVVEGFNRTQGNLMIVMDGDLQHPPELLPQMVRAMQQGADLVVPSRFVQGGSDGGLNVFRKLVSWVARGIGRIAIKKFRKISDCTGGYFGLKREVISHAELNPCSWKILMEILVKGNYQHLVEIPYQFMARDAGQSKMSLREQWNYLCHIAKLVWSSPADRRFYLFCFVGVLGLFVNLAVFSVLLGVSVYPMTASVLASLAGMVHNFLWHDSVTWKGHKQVVRWRRWLQFPQFVLVSLVGIAFTALVVRLFVYADWNAVLGQMTGIAVAMFWNYFANHFWTFRASV